MGNQHRQDDRATDQLKLQISIGMAGQLVLLGVLWGVSGLGPVGWVVGTACGATVCFILLRSGKDSLGPADLVTLSRAALAGGTAALVADQGREASMVVVAVIASAALVLDAVDGQVARRTGTASPLGARFDMEVDAFLILVLSVYVGLFVGMWVLAIGAIRYAFLAAQRVLPWLRGPLPPSRARKTVAALQGIALVVAGSGLVPGPVAVFVAGGALSALVWSFGRDIAWLWHVRTLPVIAEGALELAVAPRGGGSPATGGNGG
ncbi:CDP-alcohol phosphatidyltransferase family protein [Streptomyces sp. WMMB 322]|uniref:CDP-alcohol phosphatidyltransferase family protein n=1 Tax=Streptomyces sp. WMMB 322 TaxID=1286821 RepID=UPI0006E3C9BE|nr:CDP-alcohol phosphatidyltransferase family protein [Streptomyces sp. WMMB 322]SCK45745.1 Phosphatidylglycerophosphate synthase [Streptomyces sp. WMMB 322]